VNIVATVLYVYIVDYECPEDMFACYYDGQCINATQVCDGIINCMDNSDENFCGTYILHPFM
jgi:hypothetical protein